MVDISEQHRLDFQPGEEVFSWEAFDYHPHQRGWLWITLFCLILFGGALWALLSGGDWVMAFTFFVVAAVYFWAHRQGDEVHHIRVFERAVVIDQQLVPLEDLSGFWFVYDQGVSVVHLQFKKGQDRKISLQMGSNDPHFFRLGFEQVDLLELSEKRENLIDLWVRALKL